MSSRRAASPTAQTSGGAPTLRIRRAGRVAAVVALVGLSVATWSAVEPERASALYVTAFQIGILLGSVNGGLVYGHFGLSAVIATSAVLFAITLAGVVVRRDTFPL